MTMQELIDQLKANPKVAENSSGELVWKDTYEVVDLDTELDKAQEIEYNAQRAAEAGESY